MGKKKALNQSKNISNRRASYDYELGDSLVVGLELTGAEVKSLRTGHGHLKGAYVTVKGDELFLINATITGTHGIPISDTDKTRARKVLAKRKEIEALMAAKKQGRTIVPLQIITNGRFIKLKISVGKGKRTYDKRQTLKAKDDKRRADAAIKSNR